MMKFAFSVINLGCNKNLVDTQHLIAQIFSTAGNHQIQYFADCNDAKVEYVFLNTCGFISSARDEMIQTVQTLLSQNKQIIIWGCAIQYYKTLNPDKTPNILNNPNIQLLDRTQIDKFNVQDVIDNKLQNKLENNLSSYEFPICARAYTNAEYGYEYLKIAEGCNNKCSFCIIPQIRGPQKSQSIENVLAQAQDLIANGINEIIILAQDTTRYGLDLYGKPSLFELLAELEKIPQDFQYRLLYLYPDVVSLQQIKQLQEFQKFIPYFDIPIQHISSGVLKRMGRFYDTDYIYKFIQNIIKLFPTRFIRTNIMVGFPGETMQDVEQLISFIQKGYFDNIALFEYHDEELAISSKLDNQLTTKEIHQRFQIVQTEVDKVLAKKEEKRLATEQIGYITNIINEKTVLVRPWLHTPEIDFLDKVDIRAITGATKNELDIGVKISYKK